MAVKIKLIKIILSVTIFGYCIFSMFFAAETYLLDKPDLYVFCGKDGGKVYINYKNTDIFIDLSVDGSIDCREFINSKSRGKLDLCVFGNAYNVKNAKVNGLTAHTICFTGDINHREPLREYVESFDKAEFVKDKIRLKYDDIYLTLKVGKSYNISEAEISYKGRNIIVTNDFSTVINPGKEYVITYKMYNMFSHFNILNCPEKEIERIKL